MMVLNIAEKQMSEFNISVVVPVYNRENYLLRTLESIRKQDYRPLQLILVDNASTDNSLNICLEFQHNYQAADFNIVVLIEKKKGAACARNCGLAHCRSEYVYFFDSDDQMSPDFVSSVMNVMNNGSLDVLAVKTMMSLGDKQRVRDYFYSRSPAKQILMGMLSTVSAVYRTSFIKSLNGWNENLLTWDDWELGVRVLLAQPVLEWYKQKAFHQIYIHSDSITGRSFSDTYSWIMKAIEAVRLDIMAEVEVKKKNQLLLALYFRQIILAATICREGNKSLGDECLSKAQLILQIRGIRKYQAKFLYSYTLQGGRGAWRIALCWL